MIMKVGGAAMKQRRIMWVAIGVMVIIISFAGYSIASSFIHHDDVPLTKEQTVIKSKVELRLQAAWDDIKKTEMIDDKTWVQYNIMDTDAFYQGKDPAFPDYKFCQAVASKIEPSIASQPFNTLKPTFFVKKDQSEIIFAYKDQQGNNYIERTRMTKDGWSETEKTVKQGEKPMDIGLE